jgi:hypothetical protein
MHVFFLVRGQRAAYVVAGGDAGGDCNGDFALVCDELGDGPLAVAVAVFVDLEPARVGDGTGGRVDLGHVYEDGSVVGGIDDEASAEVDVESVAPVMYVLIYYNTII